MTKSAIAVLLSTCALAACGESTVIEPGQWQMNMSVTKVEAPGLPAGTNIPLPPPQTMSQCVTAEQARNPGADFAGGGQAGGCTSENFSMADGRISGTMQCNQGGTTTQANVTGSYTRDSLDMTMNTEAQAAGQNVRSEVRITGRRTGECRS